MKAKEMFTSLVLRLAGAPRVGHLVQVAIATWRGPETRFAVLDKLNQPPVERRVEVGAELQNLVTSVPVALRKLRRELDELKLEAAQQAATIEQLREELRGLRGARTRPSEAQNG
jgi:hypothetical protein